jgi:hypothetical protein
MNNKKTRIKKLESTDQGNPDKALARLVIYKTPSERAKALRLPAGGLLALIPDNGRGPKTKGNG